MKVQGNIFPDKDDAPLIVPIIWDLVLNTQHSGNIKALISNIIIKNDIKRFIKFVAIQNDKIIFNMVFNIINSHYKEYLPFIEKYVVLL